MMGKCCYFNKDSLVVKPTKRYPLVLWVAALALLMISGVYICLLYFKQKGISTTPDQIMVRLKEPRPCPDPGILQSEVPYVHYPESTTYSRNECACTPIWFFAILSMQRSGSGWFETLLNSHVNVSSNGEIFSVEERWSNISSILRTLDKAYNLDCYSSASKIECTAAFGFKWMLNQADVLARYKPTINVTSLVLELEQMHKWAADALDYFKSTRHILLYYEDLVKHHKKAKDVLKFLRLPKRKLSSHHVKIHTRPLSDQVENWDAVYDTLKGTAYESFLHADYQM